MTPICAMAEQIKTRTNGKLNAHTPLYETLATHSGEADDDQPPREKRPVAEFALGATPGRHATPSAISIFARKVASRSESPHRGAGAVILYPCAEIAPGLYIADSSHPF